MEISRTLYVSNFPEDWADVDVKDMLNRLGPVVDVYIPGKRNAVGKRFAFARFEKNANLGEILSALQGLSIGNHKILAHMTKFDRKDQVNESKHYQTKNHVFQSKPRVEDRSYLQVAKGRTEKTEIDGSKGTVELSQSNGRDLNHKGVGAGSQLKNHDIKFNMFFTPEKEAISWVKERVVCSIKVDLTAEDVVEFLLSKDYFSVHVSQLSHESWVVHLNSMKDRNRLLKEDKEWLEITFKSIAPWQELDTNGRRRIWLEVHGVPIHAWSVQFFKKIGNKFGKSV